MTHAYAVTNALQNIAAAEFEWTSGVISARSAASIRDSYADRRGDSGAAATSPIRLIIDFGAATELAGFGLINHNLAEDWTLPRVSVEASVDGSTWSTTVLAATSLITSRRGVIVRDTVLAWTPQEHRYWRLSFSETSGTPSREVYLGELVAVSTFTTLARTAAYGEGESLEYQQAEVMTSNGDRKVSTLGGPLATRRFSFADTNETQRDELLTMWHATQGGALAMLWVPDFSTANASANQECLFGRLQATMGWRQPDFALFDVDGFELRACGRHVGA